VNNNKEIPFAVKRIFYLYDIPGGESRGAHSKECHQFLVATSGSFEVLLDDGITRRQVLLNRPGIAYSGHLGFEKFFLVVLSVWY
jgi:hypothetical protein